jgi:hypothetical protein
VPDPGRRIHYGQQGIDFFPAEKLDRPSYMPFVGHRQDPLAMQSMCRLLQGHVPEERVDGCQPGIPSARAVVASTFQMFKEKTNERCIKIFDPKLGRHFAESFLGKLQKQAKAIAISRNRVRACCPLTKQSIGKERLEKRGKAGGNHSRTSRGISRSVAS